MTDSNFKLPPSESIEIAYQVQVQGDPPEATESTATLFKHEVGGEVLETKELVKTGGSTVCFQLSQRTLEESPLWVQFHFSRDDARAPSVDPPPMAFPLGEPEVARITAPADAKPDQQVELRVEGWGARVVDRPGVITFEPQLEPERVPADSKSAVHWRIDGTALDATGESVQHTIPAEAEGTTLQVEAYVAEPPAGEAAQAVAVVVVPRLTISVEGEQPAPQAGAGEESGDAGEGAADGPPPLSLLVGRESTLEAVLEPAVDGTFTWEATAGGDKVSLAPSEDGRTLVVTGGALSEEGEVTLKVTFRSEATGNEWTAERTATVFDGYAVKELYLKTADGSRRSKSYAPPPEEEGAAAQEEEQAPQEGEEPAEDGEGEAQEGEAVDGSGDDTPPEGEEDASGEEADGDDAVGEFVEGEPAEGGEQQSAPEGTDDFHFAPETETVKLFWKIDDKGGLVTGGRLELRDKASDRVLWSRALRDGEWTDGDHESDWNGELDGERATTRVFPDQFVTIEHSPFKLVLILEGSLGGEPVPGKPDTGWTFFEVQAHSIELALGPRRVLSLARDRRLYDTIGSLPAADATEATKLRLVSNLFCTAWSEMSDESHYTTYETAWGDGPNIPIVAKLFFKGADDSKQEAPKALGNVKFMWNWSDRPESTSWIHAGAKPYLDATLDCYKQATLPRGDNCHQDHGGKRGHPTKKVFPAQAGYAPRDTLRSGAFPFKVEVGRRRTWASFSTGWGRGALAGMSGVVFQPSRMAGDSYVVTCYLANEKRPDGSPVLDTTRRATIDAAAIKAATGPLQVWREVHMRQYLKKKSTFTELGVSSFQRYYRQAYLLMVKKWRGGATVMQEADFNDKIHQAFGAQPQWYVLLAEPPTTGGGAVNQYTVGDYAVHFRSYADWKAAVKASPGVAPAGPWTDAQFTAWATPLQLHTSNGYHRKCKDWATDICESLATLYLSTQEGANFFQFQGLHNHASSPGGQDLNGFGMLPGGASGRHKTGFVMCATPSSYAGTGNSLEQTTTHEIGHCMFMPHSADGVGATDPYRQPTFHDSNFDHCTMSYNWGAGERKFCGLCLLRLRGWSRQDRRSGGGGHGLDSSAANNTKT